MKTNLYADHESIDLRIRDALFGHRTNLTREEREFLRIDYPGLVKFVQKTFGPIGAAKAFSDWSRYGRYVPSLNRGLVELVHTPYVSGSKNSVDMRLALDAYADVAADPSVGTVVIFSCDRDFSYLAVRLRRLGKTVIGIGVEGADISDEWIRACDKFYRYPVPKRNLEMPEEPDEAATPSPPPSPAPSMNVAVNGSSTGVAVPPIPLSHEVLALETNRDDEEEEDDEEDEVDETPVEVTPVARPSVATSKPHPFSLGGRPSVNGSRPRFGPPSKSGPTTPTPRPSSTPKPTSKPTGFPTYGSGPGQPGRPTHPPGGPGRPAPRNGSPSGPPPQLGS